MNQTTNYQLNQWVKDDQVRMEDFNADNAKIDAAIKAVDAKADGKAAQTALNVLKTTVDKKADKTALSALQTVVDGKGNCKIEFGSYVGDGDGHRLMNITTSLTPKLIIVGNRLFGVFFRGVEVSLTAGDGGADLSLIWSEHGVSWRHLVNSGNSATIMNNSGTTYYYAAFE